MPANTGSSQHCHSAPGLLLNSQGNRASLCSINARQAVSLEFLVRVCPATTLMQRKTEMRGGERQKC